MPCSCGSTTCLCGIPCSCTEESCTCDACAKGLPHYCKICNKPLAIIDLQTDETACSCFVGRSKALIFENPDFPQFRIGNLPIPRSGDCYVNAKLLVNIMIPVPTFSQFVSQEHICVEPTQQSIPTDSRDILPTFVSEDDIITARFGEDSGVLSAAELNKLLQNSNEQSNDSASTTSIGSSDAQSTEMFRKEAFPTNVSECTTKTDDIVQNTKLETERTINGQENSYYLPCIMIDDVSYPVKMTDRVWRLPKVPGIRNSSLKFRNPFYVAEATNTNQADSVIAAQNTEKPLNPTEIKEQPNLKIYDKHWEFAASTTITESDHIALTGNSNWNILPEQPTCSMQPAYSKSKKFPAYPNENSSGLRGDFDAESQRYKFVLPSASRRDDIVQPYTENYRIAASAGNFIADYLPESMAVFQREKLSGPLLNLTGFQ